MKDDTWKIIADAPVQGKSYDKYAVVFHDSSHYYFGGYADNKNLNSILRLQPVGPSWTWSNVEQINSARLGHAVVSVSEKVMVIGGGGNNKNEACLLKNGQFNCIELSSSLYFYVHYPIVFTVPNNYRVCNYKAITLD